VLLRALGLQNGVYYSHSDYPRNSFSVIFLDPRPPHLPGRIRETLLKLWKMYTELQKGVIRDTNTSIKSAHHGNLSVLLGYGPSFFEIEGLRRKKPLHLKKEWLFEDFRSGGDPILPGVGLKYSDEITSNNVAGAHFVFQFIGDTQLATNRPVVETWKLLRKIETDGFSAPMAMRSFFTGFNRPDGRSWLGFHDGVSNIRSSERLKRIQIDRRILEPSDFWTAQGTYMAFLKIAINMSIWDSISIPDQERLVGRQKSTGCPLINVDGKGNNIFASGCPVPGTKEIIEKGNERFREYWPVSHGGNMWRNTTPNAETSHVGRMRRNPDLIFRQGYEFIEATKSVPGFRVGLNFVSFQGGTDKLIRVIKYGFDRVNFAGNPLKPIPGADNLLSVLAAGIFLVPPFKRGEAFPGSVVFDNVPT
jgi:deferrochelatase/peroxidase EfeB